MTWRTIKTLTPEETARARVAMGWAEPDVEPPRKVRCEYVGPMHWRIFAPGRPSFDWWGYVLVTPDGVEHTESFSCSFVFSGRSWGRLTITITEDEYREATHNDGGWCLACGEPAGGIEPDARKRPCGSCGARRVYGAEECLLMGAVEFGGES